ncbi:pyridoxal-phosphate-dependent transferase [Mycolicibacterium canariasense]|uniref:Probable hercynylcysteine sulfoxide lyase n=1 Tax=Mycolicibacterium canariasense TaxID=228230 RepID=A0A100WK25_MYCCR|nr:ergothioneine biosynthesis PLP-dependent enzyme EgtE [Mycolicibacterium canariasense]MCV7207189.1 ergothioneine biosynthesis PLP-dependent enzyme EgtE [Mycolicibacterium canariasense]ORV06573.1 ergothioneine biosynthesis PLP-dependent enzyme EgtE [Mycolicibacterium canariasense]GAS99556.1 pyridoxal-phosphate-dependent transferase [Mycolicibacterium canariasense]
MTLADQWRAARPAAAGMHFDSAACSRQSHAVIEATAAHARHEAEVGGYVAAEAATPALDAGREAVRALSGIAGAEVVYTTGSSHALDLLLSSWAGPRTLACPPGEYGPSLAIMAANDFQVRPLPVDALGRLLVDEAKTVLAADRPALVHLTALASHRGVAQPLADVATVCREIGVPLVVDAAQALGHLDCAVGPDALYSSSRKWLAGPRGVGVLALRPELAGGLTPRLGPLENGEANIGSRVGFALAVGEHLAAGPAAVRARLAEVGRCTRTALAGVAGWRVVEPADEPTALTTLEPADGADPARVRARLIDEHRIVTTACELVRAPYELTRPVLRVSPHVDVTESELERFGEALVACS